MNNIVRDGAWTTLPKGSKLRKEAPRVAVTAYKLDSSSLEQTIQGFASVADLTTEAFYDNLYQGKKQTRYVFPYFNNDFRSFTNEFADTLSNITDRGTVSITQVATKIGGELAGAAGQVAEVLKGINTVTGDGGPSTGTYIETPKFYQFANTDNALSFSFPLLNTIEEGDVDKNHEFIKEFTKLNRPERKNSVNMTFPHIYKVKLKGLRFMRWAYLDNLSFSMIGQRRLKGGKMVPEAYVCNMSFKSLTVEVANFMNKV